MCLSPVLPEWAPRFRAEHVCHPSTFRGQRNRAGAVARMKKGPAPALQAGQEEGVRQSAGQLSVTCGDVSRISVWKGDKVLDGGDRSTTM